MLAMIQGSLDTNLAVAVLGEAEKEWLVLNAVYETKQGLKVAHDIRTLPVTLYIEEVPDYRSTFEENRAALEALLSNPNADLIMLSPEMMKQLGIRDAEKLALQMQQAIKMKMQMEQGLLQGSSHPAALTGPEQMLSPEQMVTGGM